MAFRGIYQESVTSMLYQTKDGWAVKRAGSLRATKVFGTQQEAIGRFVIDSAGSYLYWPDRDVHLGPSQMLQAVNPMYLSDVEIRRYQMENVSQVLLEMRSDRRLKQKEIPGLSARHVRRLERERARLTVDAATKFASAFGMTLSRFLDELSERITALREGAETSRPHEQVLA